MPRIQLLLLVLFALCTNAAEVEAQTSAQEWYDQGNVYNRQQNYNQALQAFSKAIQIDSQFSEAYSQRGTVYYRMGEGGFI